MQACYYQINFISEETETQRLKIYLRSKWYSWDSNTWTHALESVSETLVQLTFLQYLCTYFYFSLRRYLGLPVFIILLFICEFCQLCSQYERKVHFLSLFCKVSLICKISATTYSRGFSYFGCTTSTTFLNSTPISLWRITFSCVLYTCCMV